MKCNRPTADPSEEEIRRLCAEIRSGWSAAELERRSRYPVERVELAPIDCRETFGSADPGES